MISAKDALLLPSARLRPSDAERALKILAEIEAYVRVHMDRGGCVVPIDPREVNGAVVAEIEHICRTLGWVAEFQQKLKPSAIDPRQSTVFFQLSLRPDLAAYVFAAANEAS